MNKLLLGLTILLGIGSAMAEVERCNYETEIENTSNWAGAPWADGTWERTRVIPKGPCKKIGEESELSCVKALKNSDFSCYQMTTGNKYRRYNGTLWGGIKKDYSLCFVCY